MATAPAITFSNDQKMIDIIPGKFTYILWANDKVYTDWAKWALDTNNKSTSTTNQRENAATYSGYSLKIFCDTSSITRPDPPPNPDTIYAGCCMADKSRTGSANMGGFCLISNGSTAMQTYRMNAA